jgi:hypothetical protein
VLCRLRKNHRFQIKRIHFRLLSLLHDDLGRHLWVNRAVINVGAGFRERIRVAIIGIERLGFEYVGIARNDMGNIIMVRPCDCRPSDLVELAMNGENGFA